MTEFSELVGKTLIRAEKVDGGDDDDQVLFVTDTGHTFAQYHSQDCCESVRVEEIVGDLADLIGSPILQAEEVSSSDGKPEEPNWDASGHESYTWTFYKLATIKGSVTIRWLGSSNGYYSESVCFHQVN